MDKEINLTKIALNSDLLNPRPCKTKDILPIRVRSYKAGTQTPHQLIYY